MSDLCSRYGCRCRGKIGRIGFADRAGGASPLSRQAASQPKALVPLRGATQALHQIATASVILFFMALAALFAGA